MNTSTISDKREVSALAKIVDEYMSENDLSYNGFAKSCGMSFSAASGVTSGEAKCVYETTVKKVAKGMGLSVKALFEQVAERSGGTPRKKAKKKAARRARVSSIQLPEGLEFGEDVPVVILGRMRLVAIDRIIKGEDAKDAISKME